MREAGEDTSNVPLVDLKRFFKMATFGFFYYGPLNGVWYPMLDKCAPSTPRPTSTRVQRGCGSERHKLQQKMGQTHQESVVSRPSNAQEMSKPRTTLVTRSKSPGHPKLKPHMRMYGPVSLSSSGPSMLETWTGSPVPWLLYLKSSSSRGLTLSQRLAAQGVSHGQSVGHGGQLGQVRHEGVAEPGTFVVRGFVGGCGRSAPLGNPRLLHQTLGQAGS
jgi:hypothetical protein